MDLWKTPHNSENNIQFNDAGCRYNSRSYYCQPVKKKKKATPPPPRPALPVKLKIGNWWYATLDNVAPKATLGKDKGLSTTTCHSKSYARAIPSGWELAPYSSTVLKYSWSTRCLVFRNGMSYTSSKYGYNRPGRGKKCGKRQLGRVGKRYYAKKCSRRVVIRKQGITKTQVKVGRYIYATLDSVKPSSELYSDKGLSEDGCHSKGFARAIPKGWQLAPFNKKILKFPWSTYCLIFRDGKAYGTSSYGAGNNCGGSKTDPMLAKDGKKYYAKHCNRRVAIRKKR